MNATKQVFQKVGNMVKAAYPGLYLVTSEERRIKDELQALAAELNYRVFTWSVTKNLVFDMAAMKKAKNEEQAKKATLNDEADDIFKALATLSAMPQGSIYILPDLHLYFADVQNPNPAVLRSIKETVQEAEVSGKVVVVIGNRLVLPKELEEVLTVVDVPLPGQEELDAVLAEVEKDSGNKVNGVRPDVLRAAQGLTADQATNSFAYAGFSDGEIRPETVAAMKAAKLKATGVLEVIDTDLTTADIGGCENVIEWVQRRKAGFSAKGVAYRLPKTKGVLLLGPGGTGKTLLAKIIAHVLGLPLIKFDVARVQGPLQGQAEATMHGATKAIDAYGDCVVLMDESDKALAGGRNHGASDGGTGERVRGIFMDWAETRKGGGFIVATANNIVNVESALFRKGRFDETFYVDLPNRKDREAIFNVQIRKYGRNPKDFDTAAFAMNTEGFSGAEIEHVVRETLFTSFDDGAREPGDLDFGTAIAETIPLSVSMKEEIHAMREWSKGRARPASKGDRVSTGRKYVGASEGG